MTRQATPKQSPEPGKDGTLGAKLADRTARVGVVGIGYVGLPTMIAAAEEGFKVTGIDIDKGRVDQINAGDVDPGNELELEEPAPPAGGL